MADALASGASVLRDVGGQVPLRPQLAVLRTPGAQVTNAFRFVTFVFDGARRAFVHRPRSLRADAAGPVDRGRGPGEPIGCQGHRVAIVGDREFRSTDLAESTLSASWLRAVSRGGHRGCDAPAVGRATKHSTGIPVTVAATAT